ncbi:MAG: UPF0758 domain-containing protein, partial [Myxococcota bacterium]
MRPRSRFGCGRARTRSRPRSSIACCAPRSSPRSLRADTSACQARAMLALPVPGMRTPMDRRPTRIDGPRERLRARGADALSAAELIALLLR